MKFIIGLLLVLCLPAFAQSPMAGTTHVNPIVLLSLATTTSTGLPVSMYPVDKTFELCGTTSAGAGSAIASIEVSDEASAGASGWIKLGTITLVLGTSSICDGFATPSRWKFYRANLTTLSGTTATVTATAGY
jgi:hypothetical protein